jgi:hypothetical protein
MTVVRKLLLVVLITAAAAAISIPAAAAETGAFLTGSRPDAAPPSSTLVQIGGELVAPSQVSAFQAHAGRGGTTTAPSDDGGFDWNATTIELSLLGALAFFAGVLGVLWRRGRLSTA